MAYWAADEITGTQVGVALTAAQFSRRPVSIADDLGTVLSWTGVITLASGVNPAVNDVFEMGVLPADHVAVDWIISGDQLETGATSTITVGVMTGTVGDVTRTQTAFPAANTAGNGGTALVYGRTANDNFLRNATSWFSRQTFSPSVDRSVGFTLAGAIATPVAALRRIAFQLFYRVARYGG
jgi:hypothetical protein